MSKGFKENRKRKEIYYIYYYKGRKTQIWTKMSHNPGDLDDWHISWMAKQTKLSKKEFVDVGECPMSADELLKLYLDRRSGSERK